MLSDTPLAGWFTSAIFIRWRNTWQSKVSTIFLFFAFKRCSM